jgi:hypothetical protein
VFGKHINDEESNEESNKEQQPVECKECSKKEDELKKTVENHKRESAERRRMHEREKENLAGQIRDAKKEREDDNTVFQEEILTWKRKYQDAVLELRNIKEYRKCNEQPGPSGISYTSSTVAQALGGIVGKSLKLIACL